MFSVPVLRDERMVIAVEQKLDSSEDQCYKWMSSVLQVRAVVVVAFSLKGDPVTIVLLFDERV